MTWFALELLHPEHGARRVEFVTPKTFGLMVDGTLVRASERGASSELLLLHRQSRDPAIRFHAFGGGALARPVKLNGKDIVSGSVQPGDVLHWRECALSCHAIEPLSDPERAMADAARADDAALEVYADWLETRGDTQSAEWARLVLSPRVDRMNDLSRRVGGSFRALVARGPIERCAQRCGQAWEVLPIGEEQCRRDCSTCKQQVTWCEDAESGRGVVGPVVIDPATPRAPGDLLPRPSVMG